MKKTLLLALAALLAGLQPQAAEAACANTLSIKDGAGVSQTICVGTDGSTSLIPNQMIVDGTSGANRAAVKAASTAAVATDPALVIAVSPNNVLTGAGAGATGAAVPANASYQAINVGGNLTGRIGDPCDTVAHSYTPINISTATTTRIITPVAAKKTYICSMFLIAAGVQNVGIVEGTGGTCGTGTAGVIGGTTAATGPNLTAQVGFVLGNGARAVAATAGTNVDFCLITSGAVQLSGHVVWVQL